uniref:Uncharacterized protein n=1 Tax=Leptobrachium leishanense TaxID=445787 RepID=A0A8C5PME2_9ANUR
MAHKKKGLGGGKLQSTPRTARSEDISSFFPDHAAVQGDRRHSKMAPASDGTPASSPSCSPGPPETEETSIRDILRSLPTKEDMEALMRRMETAWESRWEHMSQDVLHLGSRIQGLEDSKDQHDDRVLALEQQVSAHSKYFTQLRRDLDDVDNRGRRNNLRIRGLPESQGPTEDIPALLRSLINPLLQRPLDAPLLFDRAHRALKAKGTPSSAPRDIICRLHYYVDKERILMASRNSNFQDRLGNPLQVFPDLSWTTLQARRALRPLTQILQDRQIKYRWGYPLSLTTIIDGESFFVSSPEDITPLTSALGVAPLTIPDWFAVPSATQNTGQIRSQRSRWQTPVKRRKPPQRSSDSPLHPLPTTPSSCG